jgi:hypothetical protein
MTIIRAGLVGADDVGHACLREHGTGRGFGRYPQASNPSM